jgi:hypothetical protein
MRPRALLERVLLPLTIVEQTRSRDLTFGFRSLTTYIALLSLSGLVNQVYLIGDVFGVQLLKNSGG